MPVNLQLPARDLEKIAKTVVENPTIGKTVLRSTALASIRSSIQSKGAFASAAATGVRKGVSLALGQIPVPMVGSVLDAAWSKACDVLRSKMHGKHVDCPVNAADKVKFELKEIGSQVEDWDRYRWKISHAVEEYNKASAEALKGIASAPCDTWVRVWAKFLYLGSRIQKLRESVEAMRAILKEVDDWLVSVETSYEAAHKQVESQYQKDVAQLKTMQVHDTCSDTKCMFKKGQWTSSMSVPTSDAAKFFIKAAATTVAIVGDDPIGNAVDAATK